jgi:hypothetical protein
LRYTHGTRWAHGSAIEPAFVPNEIQKKLTGSECSSAADISKLQNSSRVRISIGWLRTSDVDVNVTDKSADSSAAEAVIGDVSWDVLWPDSAEGELPLCLSSEDAFVLNSSCTNSEVACAGLGKAWATTRENAKKKGIKRTPAFEI